MSMATYIGLNFPVELNEYMPEGEVEINYVFSDEENRRIVKEKHFSTSFIYEVWEKGAPIWQMNEYQKVHSPHNYEKSKKTFGYLCDFLKSILPTGDYCEVYICWLGEEKEELEEKVAIDLKNLEIDTLEIYEKCFIRIDN